VGAAEMNHVEAYYENSHAADRARRSLYLCAICYRPFTMNRFPLVEYEYHEFEPELHEYQWRLTGQEEFGEDHLVVNAWMRNVPS
jgi:hypothetical protein